MTELVLFLCPHGAAKSVLAAALLQQHVEECNLSLQVACAGTEPDSEVAPHVRALLAEKRLALPTERPQLVTTEQLAGADYVISLGCAVGELPGWPARWELWDDVPPPSQDLHGAYTRIQQHLAMWIEVHRSGLPPVEQS